MTGSEASRSSELLIVQDTLRVAPILPTCAPPFLAPCDIRERAARDVRSAMEIERVRDEAGWLWIAAGFSARRIQNCWVLWNSQQWVVVGGWFAIGVSTLLGRPANHSTPGPAECAEYAAARAFRRGVLECSMQPSEQAQVRGDELLLVGGES